MIEKILEVVFWSLKLLSAAFDLISAVKKSRLQFPVKWNAFSDRNGMLFSGLTEWLSDTNGMAQ